MRNSISNNQRINNNNGTQACAACKYQRRKCVPDCVLAPYFPHDRQRQFLNAHKLFGVSNITKIIANLSPPDKDIAMRTIIYQSDARAKDPVGGCYRIIRELYHQIEYCKAELELVHQQLALCKAQAYHQQHNQLLQMTPPPMTQPAMVEATVEGGGHVDGADVENYQDLLRCYYDHADDTVMASSNSSGVSHGDHHNNCFMMRSDFEGDCDGFEQVKPQMTRMNNGNVGVAYDNNEREYVNVGSKFDDHIHVDVSCCDIQTEGLKFDLQPSSTQISEEVILKEDKAVVEDEKDESFHRHHHHHHNHHNHHNNHHIPEHDLRHAATLLSLTN